MFHNPNINEFNILYFGSNITGRENKFACIHDAICYDLALSNFRKFQLQVKNGSTQRDICVVSVTNLSADASFLSIKAAALKEAKFHAN